MAEERMCVYVCVCVCLSNILRIRKKKLKIEENNNLRESFINMLPSLPTHFKNENVYYQSLKSGSYKQPHTKTQTNRWIHKLHFI